MAASQSRGTGKRAVSGALSRMATTLTLCMAIASSLETHQRGRTFQMTIESSTTQGENTP